MFRTIMTIITNIKLFPSQPIHLGRWGNKNHFVKNYYANIDHCGTCSFDKVKKIELKK